MAQDIRNSSQADRSQVSKSSTAMCGNLSKCSIFCARKYSKSSKLEHNLKHTGSIVPSRTNAVTLTEKPPEMAATAFSITPWLQQLFESPLLFPKKKGKAFEEGLCAVQLVYGDHPENGTFLHFTYHPVPDRSHFWVEKKLGHEQTGLV